MSFLAILKLLGFILWPVLFLLPSFYFDRKNFKKRFKAMLKPPKDSSNAEEP